MMLNTNEFVLSMDEYIATAEKAIRKWGHPKMLNDDSIAAVVELMMKADLKFDGRGSRNGRRMKYAQYAIGRLYSAFHISQKKPKVLSLNHIIDSNSGDNTEMYTMIDSGYKAPDSICEEEEENSKLLSTIMESTVLTQREKQCIVGYYFDLKASPAIAKELNVSHQAVHQQLTSGLKKLKDIL